MWKYLLEKEFKQFFRDPGLPRMALAFPVLMMLVFPFAVSMEVRNINLAVVDSCMSAESALLVEKCTSSGYFRLVDVFQDPGEADRLMDANKVDAILTMGSMGSQYLLSCIRMYLADKGVAAASPSAEVSEKYYFNPYMDYKLFMVPALIVIAITMITAFLPSLNIVGEKEAGTIEQINVTPVSKTAFIVCKMIPYWAVAFFILTACLVIAWLVFGYVCRGSLLWIYFFTALHILVMAGLGLLISNYSSNFQQAMFVIWFFAVVFMLMSGIFTPIASMPDWAQAITYINPMRYYADAMRAVFLKGSGPLDVWYDVAGLAGLGAVMVSWAILSYRKSE